MRYWFLLLLAGCSVASVTVPNGTYLLSAPLGWSFP